MSKSVVVAKTALASCNSLIGPFAISQAFGEIRVHVAANGSVPSGCVRLFRCFQRLSERAIELNRNYALAHYHYSYHLSVLGRSEEAIHEATEALSRDPMSPLLNAALAFVLLHARMYDQSIKQCFTAIEVDPSMTLSYLTLGGAYEQMGMLGDAIASYETGIALGGAVALQKALMGHIYGTSGDHKRAREILRELQELSKTSYVPYSIRTSFMTVLVSRNLRWSTYKRLARIATLTSSS